MIPDGLIQSKVFFISYGVYMTCAHVMCMAERDRQKHTRTMTETHAHKDRNTHSRRQKHTQRDRQIATKRAQRQNYTHAQKQRNTHARQTDTHAQGHIHAQRMGQSKEREKAGRKTVKATIHRGRYHIWVNPSPHNQSTPSPHKWLIPFLHTN